MSIKKSIVLIETLTAVSCGKKGATKTTTEQTTHEHKEGDTHQLAYACPMDFEKGKTYDAPGKCPVCEMDLVKVTENHEGIHIKKE